MRWLPGFVGVVALLFGAALIGTSCGGGSDPFCGDGNHDPGEECDDGNDIDTDTCTSQCRANLPSTTRVKWIFNKGMANHCSDAPFHKDSCTDMGVFDVRVELIGPVTVEAVESCGLGQVSFQDLPNGTYIAKIHPRDINENLLTDSPVETTLAVGATPDHEVVVPYTRWTRSYTGSFIFKVNWAGADCSSASPPVNFQVLRLEQGGNAVNINTQAGDPLNGSAEAPCRSNAGPDQAALMVPMGPATFTITGRQSAGGMDTFRETFDTFVGAGVFNCVLEFDVDSTTPDAGVPDAAPPDAAAPDGMIADAGVPSDT